VSISNLGRQFGPSSRGHVALAFAAILLVLHWAAPSFKPFDIPRQSSDADAAFLSLEAGAYRGTLPRILTRSHAFETGLTKPSRSIWPAGGKPAALPHVIRFAGPPGALQVAPTRCDSVKHSPAAHQFDARAPPLASI
jgi:hypothetical protein